MIECWKEKFLDCEIETQKILSASMTVPSVEKKSFSIARLKQ